MSGGWPQLTQVRVIPFPGFAPTGPVDQNRCMLDVPHAERIGARLQRIAP